MEEGPCVHKTTLPGGDSPQGGVQVMRAANVVHFDIKGDNILLEAEAGCSEEDFWAPPTSDPPFRVVLADFGESKVFPVLDTDTTVRHAPLLFPHGGVLRVC